MSAVEVVEKDIRELELENIALNRQIKSLKASRDRSVASIVDLRAKAQENTDVIVDLKEFINPADDWLSI